MQRLRKLLGAVRQSDDAGSSDPPGRVADRLAQTGGIANHGAPAAVDSDLARAVRQLLADRVTASRGKDPSEASSRDWLAAVQQLVREELGRRAVETARRERAAGGRRVSYLSMEFLLGRTLTNALLALDLYEPCAAALRGIGMDLGELCEHERDPGLGHGGLGRLAACFLDSLAALDLPATGYGIHYELGLFRQRFDDGIQVEDPDDWLSEIDAREFVRPEISFRVGFGGHVETSGAASRWSPGEEVLATARDMIIPGHGTRSICTLRLWRAHALRPLEFSTFARGEHLGAHEARVRAENLSRLLYPDDGNAAGRELRLRQEYFLVSASLQDLLQRHLREHDLSELANKAAIHLNDTHPALAIPELMRLLLDVHGLEWDFAWKLCSGCFSYTNHTLMPEALETWPVEMLGRVLPRHLEIIYLINHRFLHEVRSRPGQNDALLRRVSIVDEENDRRIRMANLSVVASVKVNGVSALHGDLMRRSIFRDLAALWPDRFLSVTNGISVRRWLEAANPALAQTIDEVIGPAWRRDPARLADLRPFAEDAGFRDAVGAAKSAAKRRLAEHIRREIGITVDPASMFDVQAKRIHEYKRQLLNILQVVARFQALRSNSGADLAPRTVIFAGKAASSYTMAKLIIKLVHDVAKHVNADSRTSSNLKVVFLPNYGVSAAELLLPAADLSEQISTAGLEASGTGNMKLALNGALTIGTQDGANLEIRDAIGEDNIFMFGRDAAALERLRAEGYYPLELCGSDERLREAVDAVARGAFSDGDRHRFRPVVGSILHRDAYFVVADFADYVEAQARADALWRNRDAWMRRAVVNVAGMGGFSSDRTVRDYAAQIWRIDPLQPASETLERPLLGH